MNYYRFYCSHCGQSLEAPEDMLGETIDCPSCNGKFELPNPEHPPCPSHQCSAPPHTRQRTTTKQTVDTNIKQGVLIAGAICFILGALVICVSLSTVIVYGPLFAAAFVLSIIAMAQRQIAGGVSLLVLTILLPPVLIIGTPAFRSKRSNAQQTANGLRSNTMIDRPSINNLASSPSLTINEATNRTTREPEPQATRSPTPVDPAQVLRQGLPGTKTTYDKFKGASWVAPMEAKPLKVGSHVLLAFLPYISVSDEKDVVFHIYTHYILSRKEQNDKDWIFYEAVILVNTKNERLILTINHSDKGSDVKDYGLIEHADIPLKPKEVERLSEFMNHPPIEIRFSGKSNIDSKLTDEHIQSIQTIIAGWRRLTATE